MFTEYTPFQQHRNQGAQHLTAKITSKNRQRPDGTYWWQCCWEATASVMQVMSVLHSACLGFWNCPALNSKVIRLCFSTQTVTATSLQLMVAGPLESSTVPWRNLTAYPPRTWLKWSIQLNADLTSIPLCACYTSPALHQHETQYLNGGARCGLF